MNAASKSPKQSVVFRRWNRRPFLTAEERLAKEQNSLAPYWRLDNSLCRGFLQRIASDPPTFEASKALFPFFREGSIYGVPTNHQHLHVWMTAALLAGWHFGGKYPDQALAAVEQAGEMEKSLNRLGTIKATLEGVAPLPQHLMKLFGGMARRWDETPKSEIESVVLDLSVKLLRAGIVAATRARTDANLAEFAGQFIGEVSDTSRDMFMMAWTRSVARGYGRPVIEQLRHPVFYVASEYYHDRPVQWGVMGQVLETLLFRLAVRNETHCPGLRHDELIPVVREAFEQGRRLKSRRPDLLAAIREEAGAEEWRSACNLVFRVAAMAGCIHPAALAGAIHLWEFQNYGRGHGLYGGQLERFVRYFDLAVWLGWLLPARGKLPIV